jgi:hypothetical protein
MAIGFTPRRLVAPCGPRRSFVSWNGKGIAMSCELTVAVLSAVLVLGLAEANGAEKEILLHPKCQKLPTNLLGPFVRLADGRALAVDKTRALVSSDDGKTWQASPLFADTEKFQAFHGGALLRTRCGSACSRPIS